MSPSMGGKARGCTVQHDRHGRSWLDAPACSPLHFEKVIGYRITDDSCPKLPLVSEGLMLAS